jgi:hypothetical protein
MPRGGLRAQERAAQIDGDDAVEIRRGQLEEGRTPPDAGVVDEHVDAAELRIRARDPACDVGFLRRIGAFEQRRRAGRMQQAEDLLPRIRGGIRDRNRVAGAREAQRDTAAEPLPIRT